MWPFRKKSAPTIAEPMAPLTELLKAHPNVERIEFIAGKDVLIYCRDRAMPFSLKEILSSHTSPLGLPSELMRAFWVRSGYAPELVKEFHITDTVTVE